jgi:hypothetical protein
MLVRNGRTIFQNPGQFAGAPKGGAGNFFKVGGLRNRFAGGFDSTFSAYPSGHLAPSAFLLAKSDGAISSFTLSNGEISGIGVLVPSRNLELAGSLSIAATNAELQQIVSLAASGSVAISATTAQLAGAANAVASGTVSITATNALCGAIFSVTASSTCSISGRGTSLTALAFMEAEAGGPTELSPEGLANAVWDTVLADHVDTGTTGAALSDAGGAGNPWSADLSTNNTPGTFGAFVQKLLSVAKFLGLK